MTRRLRRCTAADLESLFRVLRPMRLALLHAATAAATAVLVLAGCAAPSSSPPGVAGPAAPLRLQSRTQDGVTVSVALLSAAQANHRFGLELDRHEVQVAWIRVRNASDHGLWFIRNLFDPDFYSADEVASLAGGSQSESDREVLRQRLRDQSIRVFMPPATITEGYMFLPKVEGGRFLDLRLVGDVWDETALRPGAAHVRELRFGFAVALPDGEFDFEGLDPAQIYAGQDTPNVDREHLRRLLESLPCCAADGPGSGQGDPLNVVLIGDAKEVIHAATRSGWSFTHRLSAHSIGREIAAALSGSGYSVAPVSDLYVFGRRQDLALQRARRSIAQRNHMRLWLAPFRFEGRDVWIGQVSRDIGVKLTTKSPTLTTHVIDPEVDATREYFLHSLMARHLVERFGFVKGSATATRDAPRRNLTDDPYFSDGMRLVVELGREPVPMSRVRNLMWERSAAPIAEGQGPAAQGQVRPIGTAED